MRNLLRNLFYDYNHRGDNRIVGPGYRDYSYYSFSWQKTCIFILCITLILILFL